MNEYTYLNNEYEYHKRTNRKIKMQVVARSVPTLFYDNNRYLIFRLNVGFPLGYLPATWALNKWNKDLKVRKIDAITDNIANQISLRSGT